MRAPDVIQFEYEAFEMRVEQIQEKVNSLTAEITQKFSEIDELVSQRDHEENKIIEFRQEISNLYAEAEEARAALDNGQGFY